MKDDRLFLLHIQECIRWIEQYTQGGKEEFFSDRKTQDAVLRNLHTLTESTQRLSPAFRAGHPEIDWRAIGAFRNVVVHDYLGINRKQIWDIVEQDIPDLKAKLAPILRESEPD